MSKRRFRIPWHADLPCSEYDIPAIEAWLEDQARHGRLLKSWRYFTDCEPRECRYCLEPARKGEYKPSEDRRAAYADAGWELVCYTNGDTFSVWRSTRPDALPLRTDPAADSYAYEYLWKRYRLRLAASAAALGLLALLWAGSIFYGGMPVRNLLANPVQVWQLLAATCLLLGLLATAAADTRMLRRLLTALKTGIPMPSRAPSRRRLLLNRTFRWTGTAVNVLILLFLFLWAGVNNTSRPLSELPDAPTCLTALSLWENPADVAVRRHPTSLGGQVWEAGGGGYDGLWDPEAANPVTGLVRTVRERQLEYYAPRLSFLAEPLAGELARAYIPQETGVPAEPLETADFDKAYYLLDQNGVQHLAACRNGKALYIRLAGGPDLRGELPTIAAALGGA